MTEQGAPLSRFQYRVLDAERQPRQGWVEAQDPRSAALQLQQRGWLVLSIRPARGLDWRWASRKGLDGGQLVAFTQQLAILLDAGQPLDRALGHLLDQPGRGQAKGRALIERVRERVKAGQPLSSALGQEEGQFSPLYLSLIRAGEAGGALADSLRQLGDYLERGDALRGEVLNALIYPAFLVVGVLGSLVLLLAYVVPQFVPIFADLGVPVPLITSVILALGQGLGHYGIWLGLLLVALAWAVLQGLRDPVRRQAFDRRLLGLPVLGNVLRNLEAARLLRTLGTLLRSGVALLPALGIAHQVCSNRALQAQVRAATEQVKGGAALAHTLTPGGLLPALALQMIQVGEETGQLDAMLLKAADVFDAQARRSIARLLAMLVPSLTIVMAVLVALIMLAIMLPLMSLTSNL